MYSLSDHRWFKAIRVSLVLILPVILVRAVALLLHSLPFEVLVPQMDPAPVRWLSEFAVLVVKATDGILPLSLVVLISHHLAVEARAKQEADISPLLVSTIALVNFFVCIQASEGPLSNLVSFSSRDVLLAILVAITSAELFFLCLRFWTMKSRQAFFNLADPTLHPAIRSIVPGIVTVGVFLMVTKLFFALPLEVFQWAGIGLVRLSQTLGSQLPGLLMVGTLSQLLWFVGVHGPDVVLHNIMPVIVSSTGGGKQVFDISMTFFELYVHIGGSGSTLGLLLAILIHDRQGEARQVAKVALIPSLFNINEPVIFGLPIVFNPIYLIPFLAAPLIQIAVSYFCVRHGLVVLDVTPVPWTTPPLLGGALNSGSWLGCALQFFNILLSALIYAPFVRFDVRQRKAVILSQLRSILAKIENINSDSRILDRPDEIGHTARALLNEFLRDFGTERVYLAYQPQHDGKGQIVGVEALLRWKHRYHGPIPSSIICRLLEESNQISPVGRWALETACMQLHDWHLAGIKDLHVSVNLSPLQLKDVELVPCIEACLRANQLSTKQLVLELTESQRVPEDALSIKTLCELNAMGINLEMDDFGMGYTSILYIRRFRFEAIKLDASLTKDVLKDHHCCDIIASVVQLARTLGMRIIAEYVETQEQQMMLKRLGCDTFQGYFYSPALPRAQCLEYLHRKAAKVIPEQLYIPVSQVHTSKGSIDQ